MTSLPSPQNLAKAIANTSFTLEEKNTIIQGLRFLNAEKIKILYELLTNLQEEETRIINEVNRIDLKYKIRLEAEIENCATQGGTHCISN
jgi:hypothetical protein